ncbi:amino acid permease-domain-containing protein [Pisolithus marmoratus]|nr:amino acid permease-domain-containing protein [Pisolithus marmoratus]
MSSLWSRFAHVKSVSDHPDAVEEVASQSSAKQAGVAIPVITETESPGGLSLTEGSAGGLGRHLGVVSCTLLIIGRIIGTGIFSTPSSILSSTGSVGASLLLWVLGFILSFCGLFIWPEFGTMFPKSGGEKVYLEAVYTRPRYLVTIIFAANAILLGFTASGCIVFASNILVAAGKTATTWSERGIALGVIFFATVLHGFTPQTGVRIMNILTAFKIAILVFIVVSGWVVLSGRTNIKDPYANFRDAFYAAATFKAYAGWSNVNYVLNDVRNPVRTLKIAGLLGLGICTLLYILANVAYFAAATKTEIEDSGVTVAALFFKNVFGTKAERALSVFVALSALGNVITVTFAAARVNQELAKEGIPLPLGNRFWASNWPMGTSPLPGLIIHLIPSVVVILAPPMSVAYPFILDVGGYPVQIINFFIVIGLFYLRWKKPHLERPFKVWWPLAVFYFAVAVFLMIAPFLPPTNGVGDTPPLPYYLYCLVGIGVALFGVAYWAGWRVLLPRVFGYELVPRKEVLEDGTFVTVLRTQRRGDVAGDGGGGDDEGGVGGDEGGSGTGDSDGDDTPTGTPRLVPLSPSSNSSVSLGKSSATAYGYGGGESIVIPCGQLFAGRSAGGGTRDQIFGGRSYGSGYPGITERGVSGRGFPFWFWPVVWSDTAADSQPYLNGSEYGDAYNSSRFGGSLMEATFISNNSSPNTTFHVLSDNSTVTSLIQSIDCELFALPLPVELFLAHGV